jgi:hypothetical protein
MLRKVVVIAACACGLASAKAPEHAAQVVTTDQADFTGGLVRVNNAYGEMNVEAWDEPRVQVTVTRSSFTHDKAYLDQIKVSVKKGAIGELEITTQFPGRNRFLRLIHGLGDFTLDYRIKVPRTANLAIRHEVGDVIIDGVAGDIDAYVASGDIVAMLPEPGKYAIDAECHMGTIYTDYEGTHRSPWLVGQKFTSGTGHKLKLRANVGGISILKIPALQPTG